MAGFVMWEVMQLVSIGGTFYGAVRMFRYGGWLGGFAGTILVTLAGVALWLMFNGPAKQGGTF